MEHPKMMRKIRIMHYSGSHRLADVLLGDAAGQERGLHAVPQHPHELPVPRRQDTCRTEKDGGGGVATHSAIPDGVYIFLGGGRKMSYIVLREFKCPKIPKLIRRPENQRNGRPFFCPIYFALLTLKKPRIEEKVCFFRRSAFVVVFFRRNAELRICAHKIWRVKSQGGSPGCCAHNADFELGGTIVAGLLGMEWFPVISGTMAPMKRCGLRPYFLNMVICA